MALKVKFRTKFPALVTAQSPIILDKSGQTYDFSIDSAALSQTLSGFQTTDQASVAALGDIHWIDPVALSITGRTVPTENMLQLAHAIKDITIVNGDPSEHYFIGVFCNNDATLGNLITIVKASDAGIASQTTPREVDRSGGVTVLEFGSAPRVKMAINYSDLGSTGVLFNDALSPLFIRKPPAEYVSKFFLSALEKFKASARNPMRGEYITIIGDSELWGAGASGESTHLPNTGALTDARNNFDAPSVANRLIKWIAQEFCNGEGQSATDPLSAAYAAGTQEYRKTINVDVCGDPQFVVINTSTGLPVTKTVTTEAGARLGKTLDLQPGQELHFRHIGDWWKLVFTQQSSVSSSALRPVVTLRGVLNVGSVNSVTTYSATPTNNNVQNFYATWDDWRVKIVNPAGGGVCRIECVENHRAVIIANNALYGTWTGQFLPGTNNFDTGVSNKTTTLINGLGKNDRILASLGSTTGPDNPCRTRDNTKKIILGVWDDKPLADVILTTGSKAFGSKEVTGDPATYGYSMSEVAGALNNVANELDIAFVDYYAVSAANDIPTLVSNGTTTSGTKPVTGISSTTALRDGMMVFGAGVPLATTIRVTGATTVELSANATASATVSLLFSASRTFDGLHANDAGHNDWFQALAEQMGAQTGGKYNYTSRNVPSTSGFTMSGTIDMAGQILVMNGANGSQFYDDSTTRAVVKAVGNRFEVLSQDGASSVFRAALADTIPLFLGVEIKWSRANSNVAFAGGGQTNATQLSSRINRIGTVATAADSVKLPASAAGLWCVVMNTGANSLQLFGTSPDTINGVATGTGVPVAAGKVGIYFCSAPGAWFGGTLA